MQHSIVLCPHYLTILSASVLITSTLNSYLQPMLYHHISTVIISLVGGVLPVDGVVQSAVVKQHAGHVVMATVAWTRLLP